MLDKILLALAVIFIAPFILVATWVALILITALFAVSVKIIFYVGGAIAVLAFMIWLIDLLIEKYGQGMASKTSGTS